MAPEPETDLNQELEPLRQPSVWHYIAVLPTWIAAAVLFVLMFMTFADVILRSALDNPIEYASELTRIFLAIIVFASLPLVSWKGGHIVVDLMDPLFSRRMGQLRDIVIDLVCGVILFWPAKRVLDLAERARDFGDVTEYMGFPQFIIGWFIAAFTALTAVVFVLRGLARIFYPDKVRG
ncbi:TRAP transporter small permease subunit [Psychromarinibacter sp. C21-152]|uniref:TRAP transporter small permease protein n=1 Tax=Psychromarinibacter sediminicola TaxID=3033385 RepID=A0AAE3NZ82_9RHOB|nr:TRAP transporter small permease subunit [Psychromarinibacter sediminicola]MDF0603600.1 TRAP transporter small permease subunit [Psychromarinibacter sediminicola]